MLEIKEIKKRLELHEGFRAKPYYCTQGKLTIGIGRNLDNNPLSSEEKALIKDVRNITKDEAYMLLDKDLKRAINQLRVYIPFFEDLDDERQYALIDMCYQLGIGKLLKFKKMLKSIENSDFDNAYKECLDSDYAVQTPKRANRIALLIKDKIWKI